MSTTFIHIIFIIIIIFKVYFKFIIIFLSDTEYKKSLSGLYEYEYEEYLDQDNYGSNQPKDIKTTSIGSTKKKTTIRPKSHPTTEIESTSGENIQNNHATDMSTAESSKHYLR